MTEEDYRNAIADAWESDDVVWSRVVALVERALRDYPNSAKLWCVLGDAIQMAGLTEEIAPYPPDEVLRCYEKAASLDAECAEAQEEIGYYYDVLVDDPQRAVVAFRAAIRLGAGKTAFIGLARSLAEIGDASAALAVLEECTDQHDPDVRKIREEILSGEWTPIED
jgi:tetratricopeptide (TPR) repeat protein